MGDAEQLFLFKYFDVSTKGKATGEELWWLTTGALLTLTLKLNRRIPKTRSDRRKFAGNIVIKIEIWNQKLF